MIGKMVIEGGTLQGLEFDLNGGNEWILGRDPDVAAFVIEDPTVSREHLIITETGEGFVIKNLSDTSKTQVNGEEVREPLLLKDGDKIQVGAQVFRFHLLNEPALTGDAKDRYQDEPFELKPTEKGMEPEAIVNAPQEEEEHDSIFNEEKVDHPNNGIAEINFDLLDTGRFLLKVIGGPNNGAEFSCQSGHSYVIGTDPNSCDIVFHDTSVSRQHARLNISEDFVISIEDLKSRNKSFVDGKAIDGKTALSASSVVTVGTTSFVVYDREGNMQTLISPLLPEIVKVLQKDEPEEVIEKIETTPPEPILPPPREKPLGAFILIAIITGLFVLIAIGVTSLFKSEPIELVNSAKVDEQLKTAITPFPGIRYSYNSSTGRLLLVGHVLTQTDKNQLMYNLQGNKAIKSLDDSGIVIDELIWQNTNDVINKNPAWRGISLQSPNPGEFALTGYLKTRKEAEQLYDYIVSNFPYLDKIDRQVIVEEDVLNQIQTLLAQNDIRSVNVQFTNGDVILTGGVNAQKQDIFSDIMTEIKKIPGVRQVRSQVSNLVTDTSTINISNKYEVSGFAKQGSKFNVFVNGRIVTKGDTIDGMLIKSITPNTILLEKDGLTYRIDYNQ